MLLRTRPLASRPPVPRALRGRARVRTALDGAARAEILREAAVFVPAVDGHRARRARGARRRRSRRVAARPRSAAGARRRRGGEADVEDGAFRARRAEEGIAQAQAQSFEALATDVRGLHDHHSAAVARPRRARAARDARLDRRRPAHAHEWSHDCSIEVDELLDHAEAEGLGAIAVTDHNVFGGALEAVERARGRELDRHPRRGGQDRRPGRGDRPVPARRRSRAACPFAETVEAIRAQGGLVYIPHPFDRLHAIPDAATLHRHLAEIDVFEVYNARLLFEGYNDEALRFARKYNLTAGAGSDAHVLQGVGTGAVRMRRFDGRRSSSLSLRSAEVLRRPKSLAYLQGLKWVAQAKERVR